MSIYNNIREIAERRKIQQKDIAELMNVSTNTVNNWFLGKNSMKAEQVPIIAKILHVSIDAIFNENIEQIVKAEDVEAEYHRKCPKCEEKDKKIIELQNKLLSLYENERGADLNGEVHDAKVS